MEMILPFCVAFGISIVTMPFIIMYAQKRNIVDQPNERKIHKKPTPLLGGLGILIAFIISLFIFADINFKMGMIILGLSLITLLGILDDIHDINARKKLMIQIFCSALVILSGVKVNIGSSFIKNNFLAYAFDIFISFAWIIGIVNAINLMDGLDGLAGGVSLISAMGFLSIGYLIKDDFIVLMSVLIAGAVLGFLIYNFNPAKIFMGDGGSTLLGFVLAIISLSIPNYPENKASVWVPIIILSVPIFETGVSILRRAIRKKDIFTADKEHIHHKLIGIGLSQKAAVSTICGLSLLAAVYGLIIYKSDLYIMARIFIIAILLYGVIMSISGIHIWETASQMAIAEKKEKKVKVIDLRKYSSNYSGDAK